MGRMILILLAVITVLVACGTREPDARSPRSTVVVGTVVAGPGCPVYAEPLHGQPTSSQQATCSGRAVQADVRVRDVQSDRDVATVRSSSDGRFEVELDSGEYELQVLDPADGSTVGPPRLVSVAPDEMLETTLTFDTGVR
jgi:hypothetical protein